MVIRVFINLPSLAQELGKREKDIKWLRIKLGFSPDLMHRILSGARSLPMSYTGKVLKMLPGASFDNLFVLRESVPTKRYERV